MTNSFSSTSSSQRLLARCKLGECCELFPLRFYSLVDFYGRGWQQKRRVGEEVEVASINAAPPLSFFAETQRQLLQLLMLRMLQQQQRQILGRNQQSGDHPLRLKSSNQHQDSEQHKWARGLAGATGVLGMLLGAWECCGGAWINTLAYFVFFSDSRHFFQFLKSRAFPCVPARYRAPLRCYSADAADFDLLTRNLLGSNVFSHLTVLTLPFLTVLSFFTSSVSFS